MTVPPQWAEDAERRGIWPATSRNTWSNFAYILAGAWCAGQPSLTGLIMGLALCVLGAGSMAYHGTATTWGQNLDRFGMHLVYGALAVHGLAPQAWWTWWAMLVVGTVAGVLLVYVRYLNLTWAMGAYFLVSLAGAMLAGSWPLALGALALFAGGYFCWHVDGWASRPLGVWGHAIWHVLTAVGTAVLWAAQR